MYKGTDNKRRVTGSEGVNLLDVERAHVSREDELRVLQIRLHALDDLFLLIDVLAHGQR